MSPTARRVLVLAGPAILASLLETLVFLADRLMLARHGQDSLASMQLQGPLMWSVSSVFRALCIGTVALVARSTGAGNVERRNAVVRASLRLSSVLGVAVAIGSLLALPWIVDGLGPPDARLRQLSSEYLGIGFAALPAEFIAASATMVFAASGDTKTPFVAGMLANATNIAVNYVLIFGVELGSLRIPELGVRGAAIGTAAAFTVQAGLLLVLLRRRGLWQPLATGHAQATRDLLTLGGPAMLERVVMHAGFLAFTKVMTSLGALAMATNQALITIESICFLTADGFGVAAATVMGQALGAGEPAQARRGAIVATAIAVVSITAIGLVLWAGSGAILPVFAPDPAQGAVLASAGIVVMPLLVLAQPFMSASIVISQGLRGAGDTRSPLISALLGGLVVRVSVAWVLAIELGWGLTGVWIASLADWIVRTMVLFIVFARGRWSHST